MSTAIAQTERLGALLEQAGAIWLRAELSDRQALRQADAVLLEGSEGFERLRSWRLGGLEAGVVIHTRSPPPPDRARLEPVVLLREATAAAVAAALQQLSTGQPRHQLVLPHGTVDLDRARFACADGSTHRLSALECRLLGYLGARPGRSVPREELQEQVWDHRRPVPTRAVDMAISRLRKKIEPDPGEPTTLLTVRSEGYRLRALDPTATDSLPAGRRALFDALLARLEAGGRCLLAGPPGVGKRALAVALAEAGGVPLIDLSGARDPATAARRIAAATGTTAAEPGAVGDALRQRCPGLLVLDRADDVLPWLTSLDGPLLATTCAHHAIEGFELTGVSPLQPEAAEALLLERARAEGIALSAAQAQLLVPLLDGLPLAIELAAGSLRAMGPQELAERLSRGSLPGGALAQSLRAATERLAPDQHELLVALATAGCPMTLADAEDWLGGDRAQAWMALVDHHLLARHGDRWSVPHAIAGFVQADAGAGRARMLLVPWLTERVQRWLDRLYGPGGTDAFAQILSARGAIEIALEQALQHGPPRAVAILGRGLERVLWRHGSLQDRRELIARLRAATASDPAARIAVMWLEASLDTNHHPERSDALYVEIASIAAELGDADRRGRAVLLRAFIASRQQGVRPALELIDALPPGGLRRDTALRLEALAWILRDKLGEVTFPQSRRALRGIVDELYLEDALWDGIVVGVDLATSLRVSRPQESIALLERLVTWGRQLPDPRLQGQLLLSLASTLWSPDDLPRALDALEEAEGLFAGVEPVRTVQVARHRAAVWLQHRHLDQARIELERCMAWSIRRDNPLGRSDAHLCLSSLESEAGDHAAALEHAAEAAEAAEAADNPHLLAHARLCSALAHLLAGHPERADAALDQVVAEHLSELGAHALWSRRAVVDRLLGRAATAEREQATTLAQAQRGPLGTAIRAILDAAAAPDPATLQAYASGTRATPAGLELRLLARYWLVGLAQPLPHGGEHAPRVA